MDSNRYCVSVWNPYFLKDINYIKQVQRSFKYKVYTLCNLLTVSFNDHLAKLGLKTLELREFVFI